MMDDYTYIFKVYAYVIAFTLVFLGFLTYFTRETKK